MKKFLTVVAALALSLGARAAKAYPEPIMVTQANGERITIVLHGDEQYNWATAMDGSLLVLDDGNYRKANAEEERTWRVEMAEMEQLAWLKATGRGPRREPVQTTTTMFPHLGTPKALVLLADFQDRKFLHDDETTRQIFDAYLNQEEGKPTHEADATLSHNEGSVRKYFSDMSKGLFVPQFDVAAPVHLSGDMAVYGAGRSDNMAKFVPEVCRLADQAGVDFSQYDANDDGYVDLVYIIYAGWGQSTGGPVESIWPKSGVVSGGTYDGKQVRRYGVHSELCMNESTWATPRINGIGLFCHELSHCMGLPDFYPTATAAQKAYNPSMEYFDVMDNGEYVQNGYVPVAYTAWEREAMGWISIDTLRESQTVQLRSLDATDNPGMAYRIMNPDDPTGHEYLIAQNLQQEGWNRILCGRLGAHGMLLTHVHYNASAFSPGGNTVNNVIGHSRMTFIPAGGDYVSGYEVSDAPASQKAAKQAEYFAFHARSVFPGSGEVTGLPAIPWYTGDSDIQQLADISEDADGTVVLNYRNDSTPVTSVYMSVWPPVDTPCYDLGGRGQSTAGRGLFVRQGRKFFRH